MRFKVWSLYVTAVIFSTPSPALNIHKSRTWARLNVLWKTFKMFVALAFFLIFILMVQHVGPCSCFHQKYFRGLSSRKRLSVIQWRFSLNHIQMKKKYWEGLIIFDRKIFKSQESKSNYQEVLSLIQSHRLSKNEVKYFYGEEIKSKSVFLFST